MRRDLKISDLVDRWAQLWLDRLREARKLQTPEIPAP
jgi:hypothetical protein